MNDNLQYLALGDSISIDLYPSLEYRDRNRGAHHERLGASSLFFRNDDEVHPEFRGRDLVSLATCGPDSYNDLTADGATTSDVLAIVRRLPRSEERAVVTITAGGNDLLAAANVRGLSGDADPVAQAAGRLKLAAAELLDRMPNAQVILSTVYDPTDGTFILPLPTGGGIDLGQVGHWLADYNDAVRRLAASHPRLHLADVHEHFRGHGVSAVSKEDFWYWPESIIEPGIRGASEVRHLFLEAFEQMK